MRHRLSTACAVLLCLTAGFVFSHSASSQSAKSRSVVHQVPECQILPADDLALASGQSGIVSKVHVREGERVKKGTLLAELDCRVQQATLLTAQKEASNDVSVRFAQEAAAVARMDYEMNRRANERRAKTVSKMEIEKLRLEKNRSILEIEVSEHELEVSRLRRDEARTLVDSYRIVAPGVGVVTKLFKAPGEAVQTGEALLQCVNTDILHITAEVEVKHLASLRQGQTVTVFPDQPHPSARNEEVLITGTVFFVSPAVDPFMKKARVLIEVDNRAGWLLAGTLATIEWVEQNEEESPTTVQQGQN